MLQQIFFLGADYVASASYDYTHYYGKLAYLRIWNTNKSSAFIQSNYNKYLDPNANTDMIGFYPMYEASGNTLTNYSANSNYSNISFTLNNIAWSTNDKPTIN